LLQVGEWLKVNGDAVYGTTASPFWPRQFDWGTISKKPGKLYLHVQDPDLSELVIYDFDVKINGVNLLHKKGRIPVSYSNSEKTVRFDWPNYLNDPGVTIIELDVEDGYEVDKMPRQFADGSIEINCWSMKVHGSKANARYRSFRNRLFVHDWTDPSEYLTGEFGVDLPGEYDVEIIYASLKEGKRNEGMEGASTVGGKFRLSIGNSVQELEIQDMGALQDPKAVSIGSVVFDKPGIYDVVVKPIDDGNWNGFSFQGVSMKRK